MYREDGKEKRNDVLFQDDNIKFSQSLEDHARLEAFFLINYLFTMVMLGYDLELGWTTFQEIT